MIREGQSLERTEEALVEARQGKTRRAAKRNPIRSGVLFTSVPNVVESDLLVTGYGLGRQLNTSRTILWYTVREYTIAEDWHLVFDQQGEFACRKSPNQIGFRLRGEDPTHS